MDELLKIIKNKKLFFTVTTGRSGTKYLAYILSLLRDFRSEHETKPSFHEYYRDILNEKGTFRDFWIKLKLPYIASLRETNYSDVSHVACKGFFESIIELGIRPSFIFLKRDNRAVARSLLELDTIPLRTLSGLTYLSSPEDKGVLKIFGDLNELSDYQLCYWYTLEIDRISAYYKDFFDKNNCKYVSVQFEELTEGNPINKMRDFINLPSLSFWGYIKYMKNRNKIWNQKSFSKIKSSDINWEEEEFKLMNLLHEN